jgi:hypothetical protein
MPEAKTVEQAKEDIEEGKSPSTAAGEFVREEIHHIREGKHGARSTKQAIAIGLSKARRAGVPLEPPSGGRTSARTQEAAKRAYDAGQGNRTPRAPSRKRAVSKALKREGRGAASAAALSRQAKASAQERRGTSRSPKAAAQRGAATRMRMGVASEAARKAARTRTRRRRTRR